MTNLHSDLRHLKDESIVKFTAYVSVFFILLIHICTSGSAWRHSSRRSSCRSSSHAATTICARWSLRNTTRPLHTLRCACICAPISHSVRGGSRTRAHVRTFDRRRRRRRRISGAIRVQIVIIEVCDWPRPRSTWVSCGRGRPSSGRRDYAICSWLTDAEASRRPRNGAWCIGRE